MHRLAFLLPLVLSAQWLLAEPLPPSELAAYVAKTDTQASWEIVSKGSQGTCDFWHVKLKSQVWQGIPWEHDLVLFRPHDATVKDKVLLVNNGGSYSPDKAVYGIMLASKVKAPVAILLGIPNQPLLDGKKEDHLIAETFVRYLDTGDSSWPLLFPMVKSLVKSMDAIQDISAKEWGIKAEKFVVTGASKRGWTTWLTAAVEPRVMAIAPMVIDVVNIPEQLPHQIESFGKPSEQIHPYTERGLVPLPDTERARRLWSMVDPWSYRSTFTMPKMVVLGNNDRYWSTDALNLYWDGLPGEKYISYSPNAGHNLSEARPDGKRGLPMRAVDNVAVFVRKQLAGQPMPKLTWKHEDAPDGKYRLTVNTDTQPKQARLWFAHAPTKDFRSARWESRPLEWAAGEPLVATVDKPASGFTAFYADLGFPSDDLTLWLCTQLRLAGEKEAVSVKAAEGETSKGS